MNLITDPWIPVVREDNTFDTIKPWQIVQTINPVIEIKAPRPDFQGALYQFLIGLLQTCFAPEDEEEWLEYWNEMPEPEKLQAVFGKVQNAFELENPAGPAFMQDLDLQGGKVKAISTLLIDTPGEKTLKDNTDHFIKRNQIENLCPSCTATALFTLQINAPSGGSGHRVGLRGGGPLTTLLRPEDTKSILWKNLWLNILNQEDMTKAASIDASVFPWLGKTRVSDKAGTITTPDDVNNLQMYWGMPRRFRLNESKGNGICDLCGKNSSTIYKYYRTKNYGVNYEGAWVHPLTPYRLDPKKKEPPISLKGQKGGLGYRHWIGLVLQDKENGDEAATIVRKFNEERCLSLDGIHTASLWCYGFDMDNMKARCWYDSFFPILKLNKKQKENLTDWAGELILAAKEVITILRKAVKSAWFRRPKDTKGDMNTIVNEFWQTTEPDFYNLLNELAKLPGETRIAPASIYLSWFKTLKKVVFMIFEKSTLGSIPEDLDLKRIVFAKQSLKKQFYSNKEVKKIIIRSKPEETIK